MRLEVGCIDHHLAILSRCFCQFGKNIVAGFVPKAHTLFQWEWQNTVEEFREKGRRLKGQVRDRALSLSYHEPREREREATDRG